MSKFSQVSDALEFVKTLPPLSADGSAWAGVSEESLASCVDLGVLKLHEFKLAAAKIAAAQTVVKEVKSAGEAKEKFTPFKLTVDSEGFVVGGLPQAIAEKYNAKKRLDRQSAALKKEIEDAVTDMFRLKGMVPPGKTVVYGYRGGFAYLITDAAPATGGKKAVAFDDLFA